MSLSGIVTEVLSWKAASGMIICRRGAWEEPETTVRHGFVGVIQMKFFDSQVDSDDTWHRKSKLCLVRD